MADAIGLVPCSCGATIPLSISPGTSSPTRYKTWCVYCKSLLEGQVAFEQPASWTPSYLAFKRLLDAEMKAGIWTRATRALGHAAPYSLDELAAGFDRLAAPLMDPTGPLLDASERARLLAQLSGVAWATVKFEGTEDELERARELRAKHKAALEVIFLREDALHVP